MKSSKCKKLIKLIVKAFVFVFIFMVANSLLSQMLSPPYNRVMPMIRGFYSQEENIDIVFLGSSRVYFGCNPKIVDEELGVNSYNMATSAQSWDQSYYLLKEALRNNKPKTVVLNIAISRFTPTMTKLKYGQLINDELRFSANKVEYFLDSIPAEDYKEALFPVYRYRENLNLKSIQKNMNKKYDDRIVDEMSDKGYFYHSDELSKPGIGTVEINKSMEKNMNNKWNRDEMEFDSLIYLEKIVSLCEENSIELILVDVPIPQAIPLGAENYADYSNFILTLAEEHGITLWDFNILKPGIMDYDFDKFRDFVHLNTKGASEFSSLLARMLQSHSDGTFDADDYFYSSYQEWYESYSSIANVWYTSEPDKNGKLTISADCFCGKNVTPIYQFIYKKDGEKDYTILQDYSNNPVAIFNPQKGVEYTIRVNVRSQDNTDIPSMEYLGKIKLD